MVPKLDVQKLFKDVKESAREFAGFGLQVSSKALDVTAGALTTLRDEVNRQAEKFSEKDQSHREAHDETHES